MLEFGFPTHFYWYQFVQVCGSDGLTYPDACQLRVMTCKQGVDVRVVEEGKCKGEIQRDQSKAR